MGEIHPSHPDHELELKSYDKVYICNGCKELGIGSRYRCEQCDFDLHEDCRFPKPTTHHTLFKNSTFKFFSRSPGGHHERYCDACGKHVRGFVYHCEEQGWDLHPICAGLPSKLKVDDVEFKLFDKALSKCLWCKKRRLEGSALGTQSWSYVSTCKEYHFHVYCCMEMMREGWRDGSLLNNNMELSIQGFLKRNRRSNIAMVFVTTNVILELTTAVLDQVSSARKPQFALFGMLVSFAALFTCIFELIYEGRKEKLIWRWRGILPLPWYYFQAKRCKPFGTFKDSVGLVFALCQSGFAVLNYCYIQRNADNPIKISVFPIIFAFGLLFSQILKNRKRERPVRENEMIPV